MIETFNELGEKQNAMFMIQLKSTDNIQLSSQKGGFIIDLSKQDLELWLESSYPVLLILYDAQKEISYFTDLQLYFNENRILLQNVRKFVRIYLSLQAILTTTVILEFQKK